MPNLGPTELIIVLVLVIIVFGVGKLPEVGGALGKSIKEFKRASTPEEEAAKAEQQAKLDATTNRQANVEATTKRDAEIEAEVERRLRERTGGGSAST
jgi:sec-independent protein translocase protein TatA